MKKQNGSCAKTPSKQKIYIMGNSKKDQQSRRGFLNAIFNSGKKQNASEMVKMLTPDGKLVEVPRSAVDAAASKTKASNQEILSWMKNPSKK